jgi:cytochrome c oxidase cbb3-type subunit 3
MNLGSNFRMRMRVRINVSMSILHCHFAVTSTGICFRRRFQTVFSRMKRTIRIAPLALLAVSCLIAGQGRGGQAPSPASQRPPQTATPQTYTPEEIRAGQTRFASQCGFCHGRDAFGGETGPDLTRSALVAADLRGDKISPVVRNGVLEKGMPGFDLSAAELGAIAAFIHDQKAKAETLGGGRRSVDVADLQTGNAEEGQKYFSGAGKCASCHSATGDLAGVGNRFQGLALLQRMLNPRSGRPAPAPAKVLVTLPSGEKIAGSLASRDEFSITITDPSGARRSWRVGEAEFTVDDPLSAHYDQLGKYTDADMHNVFAYLQTLK